MATITFESLYKNRCQNGKAYYWKPKRVPNDPFASDDTNIDTVISRILAGAYFFEIDVRQYVSEVFRGLEINQASPVAKELLLTNIADESVHAAQFNYAIKAYPVSDAHWVEAGTISDEWKNIPGHPLQKASLLELGVFMPCSLAILLICGGRSLSRVSRMVAEDEQRHVATNLGILKVLGYDPFNLPKELQTARLNTIDWICDQFKFSRFGLDKDWIIDRSNEMISEGSSRKLTNLTSAYQDDMPFETLNEFAAY